MTDQSDNITHEIDVPLPPQDAFELFTAGLESWWPKEYCWSQDALVSIGMEGREGGRCTEIGPHGFQCDWGRVLAWEPPGRLTLAWQIGPNREPQPDPANASTVDVRFEAHADGTRVRVGHAGFENHGGDYAAYREGLASEYGWPFMLENYRREARRRSE